MIRLTLRQFRTEAVVGFGLLVVLGIVLLVTGPHLAHAYDEYLSTCHPHKGCSGNSEDITELYRNVQNLLTFLLLVVPALIGVFWGAPLIARELETGTFRLAWTQSVTRTSWLTAKLGLAALASMAFGGLLSLMAGWWSRPLDDLSQDRFAPGNFGLHGIVPMGYAVFAFALGATAGVVLRRTVPAMAVALAGFIGARLAVTYWVRPHFEAPATAAFPLSASGVGILRSPSGQVAIVSGTPNIPNAWAFSSSVVSRTGHPPTTAQLEQACPRISSGAAPVASPGPGAAVHVAGPAANLQGQFQQCIDALSRNFVTLVKYQPASRYWPFQIYETALFFALALALAGVCFWWVRHRLS